MEGTQDVRVQAVTPLAGPGHGQIAVRVGRVLVYINDREALNSQPASRADLQTAPTRRDAKPTYHVARPAVGDPRDGAETPLFAL